MPPASSMGHAVASSLSKLITALYLASPVSSMVYAEAYSLGLFITALGLASTRHGVAFPFSPLFAASSEHILSHRHRPLYPIGCLCADIFRPISDLRAPLLSQAPRPLGGGQSDKDDLESGLQSGSF